VAEISQIKRAITNRLTSMKAEAELRHRPMLKMQVEELEALFDMWERAAHVAADTGENDGHSS
jgi:hypothetical protein